MTAQFRIALLPLIVGLLMPTAWGAEEPAEERSAEAEAFFKSLGWQSGPLRADMEDIARIQVPEGYQFTGKEGTKKLLEAMGNLTGDSELGLLAPPDLDWFVVFEFDDIGYVKDDDRDELDPDAMLKAIREGNEAANEYRKDMGVAPMTIVGWEQPPSYNPESNNLEWAIKGQSEGHMVVNYNTRLLGRRGVMEVALVVDPDKLSSTLPRFKELLKGYEFQEGQRYAEYQEGDQLAKIGLAALVVGGAAAAGAKLGLFGAIAVFFKKAWKLLIFGLVAVGSFIRKLFGGRSSEEQEPRE